MVFQAGPLGVGEVGSVDLSHARERTKPSRPSTLQNMLLDTRLVTRAGRRLTASRRASSGRRQRTVFMAREAVAGRRSTYSELTGKADSS